MYQELNDLCADNNYVGVKVHVEKHSKHLLDTQWLLYTLKVCFDRPTDYLWENNIVASFPSCAMMILEQYTSNMKVPPPTPEERIRHEMLMEDYQDDVDMTNELRDNRVLITINGDKYIPCDDLRHTIIDALFFEHYEYIDKAFQYMTNEAIDTTIDTILKTEIKDHHKSTVISLSRR